MKKKPNSTIKLVFGLIAMIVFACGPATKQETNNREPNLSISKGQYRIDTVAILTNRNLLLFIDELDKANLIEKANIDDIPEFINEFMAGLTQDNFSIANPGEVWQSGCDNSEELPARQLIYFGINKDIALMAYYTGGVGVSEHILIFKYKGNKIIDFWSGNILKHLANKTEILDYMRANIDKKWGLNTNVIYL